jgi:hypothetical protein
MWCSEFLVPGRQTREIGEATCTACLRAAVEYAKSCLDRMIELNLAAAR